MSADAATTRIEKKTFGKTASGATAELFTLTRDGAAVVTITNQGGHIVSIVAPDRAGKTADVALGFPDLAGYEKAKDFIGSLVGRYANRIAKGRFTLDGNSYTLATNNGVNALHGGPTGFHSGCGPRRSSAARTATRSSSPTSARTVRRATPAR